MTGLVPKMSLETQINIDRGGHSFIFHDNYMLLPPAYEILNEPGFSSLLMDSSAIRIIDNIVIPYNQLVKGPDGGIGAPARERLIVGVMQFDPNDVAIADAITHDVQNIQMFFDENGDDLSETDRIDLIRHQKFLMIMNHIEANSDVFKPTQDLMNRDILNDYKMDDDNLYLDIIFRSVRLVQL